ncbi:MAG: hypothetical protein E6J55_22600 [Deltaproteobacteria bacterium]|nr:MAG: hypothetical protein E6J55_22600 [Deltaproteobacteria bacterium]
MTLLDRYRDAVLRVAARYGATNLRLFGSAARDRAGPESDLDLLVAIPNGFNRVASSAWRQLAWRGRRLPRPE